MSKVIFAIDIGSDPLHTRAKFLRYLDTLRVMGKLGGEVRIGVGYWVDDTGVGWLEPCYMLATEDYTKHVLRSGWTNGQQCVLTVALDHSMLVSHDLQRPLETLPPLACVGPNMPQGGWTKFEGSADYWTTCGIST